MRGKYLVRVVGDQTGYVVDGEWDDAVEKVFSAPVRAQFVPAEIGCTGRRAWVNLLHVKSVELDAEAFPHLQK